MILREPEFGIKPTAQGETPTRATADEITWAESISASIDGILAEAFRTAGSPDAPSSEFASSAATSPDLTLPEPADSETTPPVAAPPNEKPPKLESTPQIVDYTRYCEAVRIEPYDKIDHVIEEATGTLRTMNDATLCTDGREVGIMMLHAIQSAVEKIKINVYAWHGDSSGRKFSSALKERAHSTEHGDQKQPEMNVTVDLLGSLMVGSIHGFQNYDVLAGIGEKLLWRRKPDSLKDWRDLLSGEILAQDGEPVLSLWKIMKVLIDPDVLNSFTPEEEECLEALTREILTEELLIRLNPSVRSLADSKEAGINLTIANNCLAHMDHTKVFVFDDVCAITGMNLADYYFGRHHKNSGWSDAQKDIWHDYAVMMKGPATQLIEALFFKRKEFTVPIPATIPSPETLSPIRILENKPGKYKGEKTDPDFAKEKQITFTILKLIDNAEDEIILDQAYLMDESVTNSLIAAAQRGVKKITIMKGKPEAVNLEYSIGKYLRRLNAVEGVEIFQSEDVSHAKCIIVDKKYSLTGSANMSSGSLYYNREVALMTTGDSPLQRTTIESLADRLKKTHRIRFGRKERVMGIVQAML